MLKIVQTACLSLTFCLPLGLASALPASAQTQSATAVPLLSQTSFAALDLRSKSLYLQGVTAIWKTSGKGEYFAFVQASVDSVVTPAGDLRLPPAQAQPFGQAILLNYRVSRNPVFYHAAKQLRDLLQPQQDKADSAAAPFLADFAVTFGDAAAAEQAAAILLRIDTTGRDLETGLLRGSDLAANTFYALDLLGTIDRLPIGFHHRRGLAEALNKTVSALIARHDNHAVWQTPGQPTQNLLLNAYVVARAVRLGELAGSDATLAQQMAEFAHSKTLSLSDAGAGMLSQSEADQVLTQAYGQGKTVIADNWFTAEPRENAGGKPDPSPAKWNDDANSGLSFLGYAFERFGMQLDTLRVAPAAASLSSAQIYVVAAPASAFSHDVSKQDADAIEAWVKDGGVLVLIENQEHTVESQKLNVLSNRFGMHFVSSQKALGQDKTDEQHVVATDAGGNLFRTAHRLFLPGSSSLSLSTLAHPVMNDDDGVQMAVTSVGRGTVLAIANPWLWNEFLDGRKLVPASDNYLATIDLAGWLLKQTLQ